MMTEQSSRFNIVELNRIPKDIISIIFEYDNEYHKKKLEQVQGMNLYFKHMADIHLYSNLSELNRWGATPREFIFFFNKSYYPKFLDNSKDEDYDPEQEESELEHEYYCDKRHRLVFKNNSYKEDFCDNYCGDCHLTEATVSLGADHSVCQECFDTNYSVQ
jgi:hypothetical protein